MVASCAPDSDPVVGIILAVVFGLVCLTIAIPVVIMSVKS